KGRAARGRAASRAADLDRARSSAAHGAGDQVFATPADLAVGGTVARQVSEHVAPKRLQRGALQRRHGAHRRAVARREKLPDVLGRSAQLRTAAAPEREVAERGAEKRAPLVGIAPVERARRTRGRRHVLGRRTEPAAETAFRCPCKKYDTTAGSRHSR